MKLCEYLREIYKHLRTVMSLITTKLPSGRWGIYNGERLLLTVGSQQTLNVILTRLSQRQIPVKIAEA